MRTLLEGSVHQTSGHEGVKKWQWSLGVLRVLVVFLKL